MRCHRNLSLPASRRLLLPRRSRSSRSGFRLRVTKGGGQERRCGQQGHEVGEWERDDEPKVGEEEEDERGCEKA